MFRIGLHAECLCQAITDKHLLPAAVICRKAVDRDSFGEHTNLIRVLTIGIPLAEAMAVCLSGRKWSGRMQNTMQLSEDFIPTAGFELWLHLENGCYSFPCPFREHATDTAEFRTLYTLADASQFE